VSFTSRTPFRNRGPFRSRGPFRTGGAFMRAGGDDGFFAAGLNLFASQQSFDAYTAGSKTMATSSLLSALGWSNASATTNPPGTVVGASGNVQYGAHNFMPTTNFSGWTFQASVNATLSQLDPAGGATGVRIDWGGAGVGSGFFRPTGTTNFVSTTATRHIWVRADSAGGTVELCDPAATVGVVPITLTPAWQQVALTEAITGPGGSAGVWIRKRSDSPATVYAAFPQVNLGPSVLPFVPNVSAAAVYAPRFTYERGATENRLLNSEALTVSAVASSLTVTDNASTARSGVVKLSRITEQATSAVHRIRSGAMTASNGWASAYARAGERTQLYCASGDAAGTRLATFDLATGTVTLGVSPAAFMEPMGDGSYRCWVSGTFDSSGVYWGTFNAGAMAYLGDGTSGMFLGGLSLSAGITPYLRTFGTAPLAASGTPQSQNLLPNSEAAFGAVNGGTVTANASTTPSGFAAHRLTAGANAECATNGTNGLMASRIGSVVTVRRVARFEGATTFVGFTYADQGVGATYTINSSGGTVTAAGGLSYRATSLGSGWWLLQVSVVVGGSGNYVSAYVGGGAGNTALFGEPAIYEGTADLAYAATTGTPVSVYPQKSLRREPARTNLVLWNRDFTNAAWTKVGGLTVTANSTGSLLGANDACMFTGVAATTTFLSQAIAVAAGTARTASWVVKTGTSASSRCRVMDPTWTTEIAGAGLNWNNGVPSIATTTGTWSVAPTVEPMGAGWWRVKGTYATGALTSVAVMYYPSASNDATTGYLDLVQDELGGWATSPIITTTASVTRSADLIRPGNIITDGPQTLRVLAALDKAASGANQYIVGRGGGGAPLFLDSTGKTGVYDGSNTAVSVATVADGVTFAEVTRWGTGTMAISLNGATPVSFAFDGTMGAGTVGIGDDGAGGNDASMDLLAFSLVSALASDAQLQAGIAL
jgi:hypothetical protein